MKGQRVFFLVCFEKMKGCCVAWRKEDEKRISVWRGRKKGDFCLVRKIRVHGEEKEEEGMMFSCFEK
jgi:hypothetical protein